MAYTSGRTYLPYEAGGGGAVWGTLFSSPGFLTPVPIRATRSSASAAVRPTIYYEAYNNFQDADRIHGERHAHQPRERRGSTTVSFLAWIASREDNQSLTPRNDPLGARYASFSGVRSAHRRLHGRLHARRHRQHVRLPRQPRPHAQQRLAQRDVGGWTVLRAQVALPRRRCATASRRPACSRSPRPPCATCRGDEVFENNTVGGFVQQQLVWNNRLFVTAAVRADDNSAFGTNFDIVTLPQAERVVRAQRRAVAVAPLGRQPAPAARCLRWQRPAARRLRRHAHLRGAGRLPDAANAGNPDLGPERSLETEIGVDAGLWNDRVGPRSSRTSTASPRTPSSRGSRRRRPASPVSSCSTRGRSIAAASSGWCATRRSTARTWGLDFTVSGSALKLRDQEPRRQHRRGLALQRDPACRRLLAGRVVGPAPRECRVRPGHQAGHQPAVR